MDGSVQRLQQIALGHTEPFWKSDDVMWLSSPGDLWGRWGVSFLAQISWVRGHKTTAYYTAQGDPLGPR